MDTENRSIVNEEEVYTMTSSGNITYNEIVSPGRNIVSCNTTFRPEWQNFPEFQSWLRPIPDDKTKAWCQACEKVFKADLKSLRVHGVGRSHVRMVQAKYPEAAASSPPPAAVYNVITDRKGTYGLGILSKTDSNPTAGSTLYVNPTNPNTNVLTCDPKQDKDNFVIVSMPKGELEEEEHIQELQQLQFDQKIQKKSQIDTNENNKMRTNKRLTKSPKTCENFPDDLIETEGELNFIKPKRPSHVLQIGRLVNVCFISDIEEEEEDEEDDDDDDDSMYDFESKVEKAKFSMNRKRTAIKRDASGFRTFPPQSYEVAMGKR